MAPRQISKNYEKNELDSSLRNEPLWTDRSQKILSSNINISHACGMEFMHATRWLVDHHFKIISVKLKSTKSEIIDPVIIVIVINQWCVLKHYVYLFALSTVIIFSRFVNYKWFGPIPWYCMCSPNLPND